MGEESNYQELVTMAELLRVAGELMKLLLQPTNDPAIAKQVSEERQHIGLWLVELGNALQERTD
jgi:hypothetical protein